MSSALAVAATSFVLVDLLNNGLIDRNISGIGNITVNALPPDRINIQTGSQLALFLYHVSPNPGWRNAGLPGRDAAGNRVSNPPLALDLHYLLIAFGAEELHAEILLGYAMQLLHETPVLTRDAIRKSLAGPTLVPPGQGSVPAALLNLYTSELAEQVEMIKITQQILTLDELSNLWTSFQTQYRLCAAYQASVVLIESRASTRNPLPVKSRTVQAIPFQKPWIDSVWSKAPNGTIASDQMILKGYDLVLKGSQLRGELTSVLIDSTEVVPQDSDIQPTQVIVQLPDALEAGPHTVQLIQQVPLGSPPTLRPAVESNGTSFVLHPTVTATVSDVQGTGGASRSGNLNLTLDPPVGPYQRVTVLLNQLLAPASPPAAAAPLAYSFQAPPLYSLQSPPSSPPLPTSLVVVPFTGVAHGDYLVRAQVDGADSPLGTDANGMYMSPKVTVG
jgi:hypothetical protein